MNKENRYADLKEKYPDYIIIILQGYFYGTYEKSAIFLHKNFGYKLYKSGNRIATGFPFSFLEDVLEKIRSLQYNYVVVKKYKIIELYEKGSLLDKEYDFAPDEVNTALENEKKLNILLTISKSEYKKIEKFSKAKNKSINQYIEDIIDLI